MKKAKKTKAPQRRTELDRIVTQLRAILRRETSDVVLAGNLLIKARKLFADEHGEWQPWLEKNFDLSYRTAVRYVTAAEYVERQKQKCHVSHFTNLSVTVLYGLAAGHYSEQEEAAILAATRKGRVDTTRADAICDELAPPDDDDGDGDDDDADDQADSSEDHGTDPEDDPEIKAILDGPPPAVPPPAPLPPPPDFALRDFDEAIGKLKTLHTKPSAQFAGTDHSGDDLQSIIDFINAVIRTVMKAKAAAAIDRVAAAPNNGKAS